MSALQRLPDLALTDHNGNARRLSELVAGDPVVLQTYRGWWCPKEQRLVGAPAAPAGPVIERYGAAQPWPGDRFDALRAAAPMRR